MLFSVILLFVKNKPGLFFLFQQCDDLVIALSQKKDGSMKIRYEMDVDQQTLSQREKFLKTYDIDRDQVVSARLVQEEKVAVVGKKDAGKFIQFTDGLITNQKNVFLAITVADCLPIFLFDSKKKVVGILHAGWRGLHKMIISNGIAIMQKSFRCESKDIFVGTGPGIGVCHFAVNRDVESIFSSYPQAIVKRKEQIFVDLKKIALRQALELGIRKENIEISTMCTYCESEIYFSKRRDNPISLQAQLGVIGLKPLV